MNEKYQNYGPTVLRLVLGLLFILPGLTKLANPGMIIGMLRDFGFPAAAFWGWVLIIVEIFGGGAVLFGWKIRTVVWPLVVVLAVALLTVHFPAWFAKQPMALISVLFHLVGIGGLVSLYFSGPGVMSVKTK